MLYQLIGFFFLLSGFSHLFKLTEPWEIKIAHLFQGSFKNKPWLPIFQEIWFFGRTSFAIIILLFLTAFNWHMGSVALVVFLIIVGIENLIKNTFTRARPYSTNSEINKSNFTYCLCVPGDSGLPGKDGHGSSLYN